MASRPLLLSLIMPDESPRQKDARSVGLPPRVFLFTVDQVAYMLNLSELYVKRNLLFYFGRSTGVQPKETLLVRNIAPAGKTPEWRCTEQELVRFLRRKGYRVYDRAWVTR